MSIGQSIHNVIINLLFNRGQCPERFMPPNANGSDRLDVFFFVMRTFVGGRIEWGLCSNVCLDFALSSLSAY